MSFVTTVRVMDESMLKLAKLSWLHVLISIVMAIILAGQLYFIYYALNLEYISNQDIISILTIIIPIGYFIYLYIQLNKLKRDKRNGFAHIQSGEVTSMKIERMGSGKSSTYLHFLFSGEDKIVVEKWFYDEVNVGDEVEFGTLPLSGIVVLQRRFAKEKVMGYRAT